jgi:hypothetical protein
MHRSLSLGLLLVALSALPAAARGSVHVHFGSHPHFVRHFNHFNHFNGFSSLSFNGSFGSFGFNSFGFNRFGRSRFSGWGWSSGSGWGSGWGDWADWDGGQGYGGASGTMIVLAGPPTAAPAPSPPAKATVETEAGVTVFRGPGSHHLR